MNNDYKQVYKNTGTVPRTTDEAYNTANYAYPIQRFKSEYDDFKDFMIGMFIWLVIGGLAFAMFYGLYVWLG
jgi:hypothetical protein